jgi:HlyD family secretion protein
MRFFLRTLLIVALVVGVAAAAYRPAVEFWKDRNRIKYRHAETVRGRIVSVVNSTGTVKPVLSVSIGSFVSGPILELHVDFNDRVKKGDLLARLDPRIYAANVARDKAALATALAEVNRIDALYHQALNAERRAHTLKALNRDIVSPSEMDQYKFSRMSIEAQLEFARAQVDQAQGNLKNSEANLEYTNIRSPVDGTVIDRKVELGQTLAAAFQTPELFVIAPDMDQKMHVYASVDEADIGLIRQAQEENKPVHFTVAAYPEDLFAGTVYQIRKSSTTTNNVVTYPVIVEALNPDLKLAPGMTANLSFEVESRDDVVKIPNSALRFFPEREQVREEDRPLLDGVDDSDEEEWTSQTTLPAVAKAEANRNRSRRHVWIEEDAHLKAIEVIVGISDHEFTELVAGDLAAGQKLVTGIEPET